MGQRKLGAAAVFLGKGGDEIGGCAATHFLALCWHQLRHAWLLWGHVLVGWGCRQRHSRGGTCIQSCHQAAGS